MRPVITVVGFSKEEATMFADSFILAVFNENYSEDFTVREHYLNMQRVIGLSAAVVCNLAKNNLSPDEVVLIHTAYTKSTPIFAVGHNMLIKSGILSELVSNSSFADLTHVFDHITAHYGVAQ